MAASWMAATESPRRIFLENQRLRSGNSTRTPNQIGLFLAKRADSLSYTSFVGCQHELPALGLHRTEAGRGCHGNPHRRGVGRHAHVPKQLLTVSEERSIRILRRALQEVACEARCAVKWLVVPSRNSWPRWPSQGFRQHFWLVLIRVGVHYACT